jgi:hypothetical protein
MILARTTQLDGLSSAIPIAAPIAVQHGRIEFAELLETDIAGKVLAAEQRVNGFWLGFAFHGNQIKFEKSKFFHGLFPSSRSEDNRDAVIFGLTLQA